MFTKATKRQSKLRLALIGPAGSGKTYSALAIAKEFGKTAVIDTERGSASLYSDIFSFDVAELDSYEPERFVEAIKQAENAGYDVIVIDSLSHAWAGTGGVLDQVDNAAKLQGGSTFAGWKTGTKMQNNLIETILKSSCHVICTMRSKMDYVLDKDQNGKPFVRKVGMAPVQRNEIEFEFTLTGDMNQEHDLIVTKTRCAAVADKVFNKPGKQLAETLKTWLSSGAPEPVAPAVRFKQVDMDKDVPPKPAVSPSEPRMNTAQVEAMFGANNPAYNGSQGLENLDVEETWPFNGKHQGTKLKNLPLDYVEWVVKSKRDNELRMKGFTNDWFEKAQALQAYLQGEAVPKARVTPPELTDEVLDKIFGTEPDESDAARNMRLDNVYALGASFGVESGFVNTLLIEKLGFVNFDDGLSEKEHEAATFAMNDLQKILMKSYGVTYDKETRSYGGVDNDKVTQALKDLIQGVAV